MTTTSMLTTLDNPYDPFTQYDEWYKWDVDSGYNSIAFLARITNLSDDISEADLVVAMESAIDEVVLENVSGMWIKVSQSSG